MNPRDRMRKLGLLVLVILGVHLCVSNALDTSPLVVGGKTFNSLTELCSMYGLQPAGSDHYVPKIFDFFLAGPYELDMMEIRLQTLAEVVDAYVPVESRMTFQGKPKPLVVPTLFHQLPAQLINKIRYLVFDTLEGANNWDREHFQRQSMITVGIKHLGSDITPKDVILLSDCDEIPKPWFLHAVKYCDGVKFPLRMKAQRRLYSFDRVFANDTEWVHPSAFLVADAMTRPAKDIRLGVDNVAHYANSSWTCSWCFDSVALMQTKLASYSHSEQDVEDNRKVSTIMRRVRMGLDIFRRDGGEPVVLVNDTNVDIPAYITRNPSRFGYLLSRDVADAGFRDVHKFYQEPNVSFTN